MGDSKEIYDQGIARTHLEICLVPGKSPIGTLPGDVVCSLGSDTTKQDSAAKISIWFSPSLDVASYID